MGKKIGSSPRVRGTCPRPRRGGRGRRFIPACAGNIDENSNRNLSGSVHPRVCGEHSSTRPLMASTPGSSPRVRGTCYQAERAVAVGRFIPACAGNMPVSKAITQLLSVHPRVCGEHHGRVLLAIGFTGSSPRVRGTSATSGSARRRGRFIPACAGNIHRGFCTPTTTPVHPRVCGEHLAATLLQSLVTGSSPRVRGT